LVQLQKDIADIEATGTQVVGVSYDSIEVLRNFAEPAGISFPLLSDEGSKTIREFGIHFRDGLPHPGTYLIDEKGIVRAKFFREGYRERHDNSELIEAAKKL
jgi:peroxiredoxin